MPAVPDFDRYFAVRRYLDLAIRPDGSEVAYATDISGSFNAWRQSAGGGWPYQLTAFRDRVARRVAFSPDGERIVVAADREGDENEQLFVLPAAGGTLRRLTPRDDVRHLLASHPWAPDGRTLACASNAEDPARFDLVMVDAETGAARRFDGEPGFHAASCWSPGGRLLAGISLVSNTHQDVVVADRETGKVRRVTAGRPEARREPVGFSADGTSVYLLTDEGREFQGLARFDLAGAMLDWVKTPEWDVDLACLSADARWLLYVVNVDAVHRVHLLDRNSGIEPELPPLPMGKCEAVAIAADGSRAAFLHSAARRPAEVVVKDLTASKRAVRTITHGMIGGIPERVMAEPRVVRYPSFDRKVPALLFRPPDPPKGAPGPALLWIHGGPEVQEQPQYRPLFQFLVAKGFVVLAPNIRGSTGYGKTYQSLVHRDFGGGDLMDLEAAARFLREQPGVDAGRIAVAGGSYGGFAALSCASRLPDLWAACIDICGPTNLVSFAKTAPPSWRGFLRETVGDHETDAASLLERSPITYAAAIRCPLLVIQGEQDPRCVKAESDRLVEKVREGGGTVDYLVFPDEGHGFMKKENELRAYRAMAEFLLRHLGQGKR